MSLPKENAASARVLHITDTHLSIKGTAYDRHDHGKVTAAPLKLGERTREEVYDDAFKRVVKHLKDEKQCLDAVVFSGDALARGPSGGDGWLLERLLKHFRSYGITGPRIVAVPGNHDIPRGTSPGTPERYKDFIATWRSADCVTPWLDGVDDKNWVNLSKHVLLGPDSQWAIFALNSSNWSQTSALSEKLEAEWDSIPERITHDGKLQAEFAEELRKLRYFDMARFSDDQCDVLKEMTDRLDVEATPAGQLRIFVMHHHLRSPDMTEELKAFSDITNLERLRQMIAEQRVSILMHGHKHVARKHFDYIEAEPGKAPHRVLMLSGGSASPHADKDAMSIVELSGLPWVPEVATIPVALPVPGVKTKFEVDDTNGRLWPFAGAGDGAPIVVRGTDYNQVYERAMAAARLMSGAPAPLIVHLDLEADEQLRRLPDRYPDMAEHWDAEDGVTNVSADWLNELVQWWQQPTSQMQSRVPYRHGERLRRFSKNIDQLKRAKEELEKKPQTTRALAFLVDPAIDFAPREDNLKTEFASFCLVQFRLRTHNGQLYLDCVAYYRVQEIAKWWPVNAAELRFIQDWMAKDREGEKWNFGRITTIAAEARVEEAPPSDVAVPIIDRWLDQAPQKLFLVAHSMLSGGPKSVEEKAVASDWLRCLKQLQELAKNATPSRVVVAIEGPNQVAAFLGSVSGEGREKTQEHAETLVELGRGGDLLQAAAPKKFRTALGQFTKALRRAVDEGEKLLRPAASAKE